jgi:hypothetical protein
MIAWVESAGARRAAGTKTDNSLGPLTSAFLKIAALGEMRITGIPDTELATYMSKLSGVAVSTTRIWNARRRGRAVPEMLGAFTRVGEADETFLRRLYRTRPLMVQQVVLRLLAPDSEALHRLDKIMAEEDERESEKARQDWLDNLSQEDWSWPWEDEGKWPDFSEEYPVSPSQIENSTFLGQPTDPL